MKSEGTYAPKSGILNTRAMIRTKLIPANTAMLIHPNQVAKVEG